MATIAATSRATAAATPSASYERLAGICGVLAGLTALLYAIAFVVLRSNVLSALFLLVLGLLATAVVIGIYQRVREVDASFALLGLVLGLAGAIGSAIHGGYELSNALHPPPSSTPTCPTRSTHVACSRLAWPGWAHGWWRG
jgi:hypothetical protein